MVSSRCSTTRPASNQFCTNSRCGADLIPILLEQPLARTNATGGAQGKVGGAADSIQSSHDVVGPNLDTIYSKPDSVDTYHLHCIAPHVMVPRRRTV